MLKRILSTGCALGISKLPALAWREICSSTSGMDGDAWLDGRATAFHTSFGSESEPQASAESRNAASKNRGRESASPQISRTQGDHNAL